MAKDEEKSPCDNCNDASCKSRTNNSGEANEEQMALCRRLRRIKHKILVLSGKGGVGKSTVATNLACALSKAGFAAGLMDVDIHGPSVPRMLGLDAENLRIVDGAIVPAQVGTLKVMSIAFMLRHPGEAVIWRGPMKMSAIKQFVKDVDWGDLDILVVDCPPGTGDEPLSVAQVIPDADGAVIVTTPQEVALTAVRRSVMFCRQLDLAVLGIVENMSGLTCPDCGARIDLFGSGGGRRLAEETGTDFLGAVPIDPAVMLSGDAGQPFASADEESASGSAFKNIVEKIREKLKMGE